jgi:hypothetical protein
MNSQLIIAFDKSNTARTVDAQGFLHVAGCNISKACVNPYLGAEVPDSQKLGLDPARMYQIFRDPEELAKAASTFNNLPLLDTHVEVGAADFEDPEIKKHIVGSTGQVAEFKAPYLVNDLVIWTAGAIEGVETKEQTELSCAYRYQIDMTPGNYEGQPYDGRMTQIIGNHVALVEEGRAGHDVVVADSKVMDVVAELVQIKKKVTDTMKPGAPEEGRKALDDMTGALDIAVHHLLDYEEDFPDSITVGVETEAKPLLINVTMDVVRHVPGHKDSKGEPAPWVVKSEKDGSVLWSGKSKQEAVAALRNMKGHAAKDDNPEGINQYTGGGGGHKDAKGKALKEGHSVRIKAGLSGGHKSGIVSSFSPEGEYAAVRSPAGKHLGYYAMSDLHKIGNDSQLKIGAAGAVGKQAQDSKESHMAKNKQIKLTPRGCAVQGALLAHLRPRLAADAAVGPKEVAAILRNIKPERYAKQIPGIVGTVKDRFGAKLAKDADLDIEELKELLENIGEMGEELDGEGEGEGEGMEEDVKLPSDDEMAEDGPAEQLLKMLEGANIPPADLEVMASLIAKLAGGEPAADEFPPEAPEEKPLPPKKIGEAMEPQPVTKPAMDAALKLVRDETRKETITEIGERYEARDAVKPYIGHVNVLAADSADAIYKLALDAKKIKTEGVHPSAYKAMVAMLSTRDTTTFDEAAVTASGDVAASFHEVFPDASRVGKA